MKMMCPIRQLLAALALPCALVFTLEAQDAKPAVKLNLPIAPGPYLGQWQSLSNYHCPDWFRDAKFGIWAHWGPQAVPMDGDWYARGMYEQGSGHYKHHLATYGHPSTNGYKDIIPLWKAEKWDPERLMDLYKRAGARYFVSMGCHHDNFDLWNSKFHEWNAVNMGPHRDVVGEWQKAALKRGLRFGVSEHMGASFTWFQVSHKSDKTGLLAGVPYDGADPKYESLYHQPADPNDKDWYSKNPVWHQEWYNRIKDLVDNYHLDLLYTDGGVPFGNEVGRTMIANLYNTDLKDHGNQQVVYCCKQKSYGMWIEDLERGVMPKINPDPWQTDTSIGDWYYNKNWKFRPVSWVIHMLADIVSKNGNLLLNVVQRPDGSLDAEVEQMLKEMAAWNAINGEAIFGTRPWLTYGEGPVRAKGGNFKEDFGYTSKDVRFTTKGKSLYAIALGWPEDSRLVVKSLAKPAGATGNKISRVSLLGYRGRVKWSQTPDGLVVELPAKKVSDYACTLKIAGTDLQPVTVAEVVEPVRPDSQGTLTLGAAVAELHGDQIKQEEQGGQPNIGFWDRADEWVSWKAQLPKTGKFKISVSCASLNPDPEFVVEVAGQKFNAKAPQTGGWDEFKTVEVGQVEIKQAGELAIAIRPRDAQTWKAINLREVKLIRVE